LFLRSVLGIASVKKEESNNPQFDLSVGKQYIKHNYILFVK